MKLISQIIHPYRSYLGPDYEAFHNHAQRVYQYAVIFLLMRENKKLAIVSAFHDLDLWVSGSMDYLPGSAGLARAYLSGTDFGLLPDELDFIIRNHHKLRPVKGNIEAEAFRKADLTDLTAGHIRFNIPESIVSETEKRFPRKSFTRLILKKSLRYALKHPTHPFPMIKW